MAKFLSVSTFLFFLLLASFFATGSYGQITVTPQPGTAMPGWKSLQGDGFRIQYPPAWTTTYTRGNVVLRLIKVPEARQDVFQENIELAVQEFGGLYMNLDQYADQLAAQISAPGTGVTQMERSRQYAAGTEYQRMVYMRTLNEVPLIQVVHVWLLQDKAYLLTYTGEAAGFGAYAGAGAQIMNSFKPYRDGNCLLNYAYLDRWYVVKWPALLLFTLLFLRMQWTEQGNKKILNAGSWLLIALTLLLCWIPNVLRCQLNPDEGQWLAQANSFYDDPGLWISYFLPREFSRILTILPLSLFTPFRYPLHYIDARFCAVLLWSLFALSYFFTLKLVFNRRVACIGTLALVWLVAFFTQKELVAYNSELPAIVLIGWATYLLFKVAGAHPEGGRSPALHTALLGIAIPAIPFAKEQALFLALLIEAIALFTLVKSGQKKGILLFLLSNALAAVVLVLPIFLFGHLDYVIEKLAIAQEYIKNGNYFNDRTWLEKMNLLWVIFKLNESGKLIFGGLTGALAYVMYTRKQQQSFKTIPFGFMAYAVLLLLVAAYAIYAPNNFFWHYVILALPAGAFLLGFGIDIVVASSGRVSKALTLAALLAVGIWAYRAEAPGYGLPNAYAYTCRGQRLNFMKFTKTIRGMAKPGDRLVIWGYNNTYYVETGLPPGARDLYIHFLNPSYKHRGSQLAYLNTDLQKFKPKFILELVGPDQMYTTSADLYAIRNFPSIAAMIQNEYYPAQIDGNEKLYIRKQ